MKPDKSLQTLFNEALERDAPVERARFLDDACGADAALRERVEKLLRAHDEAGGFFSQPSKAPQASQSTGAIAPPLTEKPGDLIGRYKLLQQIGEGGCGVVYMAEQQEPVRRRVALKVIKLGMDTKQVIARFEAERQTLAMMDHPNISRVLDAGATETGRPFFVMELVRGVKITEFCDENKFATNLRVKLFIQVCQAIQHAHQKGVIHRDIKPSNILVTINDGVPVPKVIDFGIAKATAGRLTDHTLFTAFEQFIGTPAYMSPEQAVMTSLDIDTRSDIYSLGVLLYELLTGSPPFDQKQLLAAGLDEMRRTIREVEPVKPSTRLTRELVAADVSPLKSHPDCARNSRVDSRRLLQEVKGDLDWIVMKCLEKDRARRYETANGLATDIERHLNCEPVIARPPSRLYELQKTVRRHKFGFAAAGAVMLALAIGLGVATWRFARERQAYQRAVAAEAVAQRKQADAEAAQARLQSSERQKRHNLYVAEMHLARAAWEEGQLGKAMELLRSHLPEPDQDDLRGFEWRYLWRLCQGDAMATLTGHRDYVQCLALAPEGRLLATGSGDGVIKLWDTVARRENTTLLTSTNGVRSLAFSPDGKTLAAAYGSTWLELWDVDAQRTMGVMGGLPEMHKMVRFLPNGRLLACAAMDGAVTLWDVETKTQVGKLQGDEKSRPAIAVSPDGATLAAASGHSDILLWDVATRHRLTTLSGHSANVVSLQFSPDGATLASSSADTTIRLWDIASRRELALLRGHKVWVSSIAFSPNGKRLVSMSVDGLIKLWDVASRAELGVLRGHNAWVNQGVFFPDGRELISVSDDRTIKFWDTSIWAEDAAPKGQAGPAKNFHFLPDSRSLAVLVPDGNLTFWDVASGRQTAQLAGNFKEFSDSGRLILGERASGEIELWDSVTRQVIATIREQKGAPVVTAFSRDDGFVACVDREGMLRVWEVATGRLQTTLPGTPLPIEELWFPKGEAGSVLGMRRSSEAFRFWDLQAGREMDTLPKKVRRVEQTYENGFSMSLVHDEVGGVKVESRAIPANNPTRLVSSLPTPDGKMLIVGGERDITLWDVETGRRVSTLVGHGGWVRGLALSPDGRILASAANDGALKLWNLALQKEVLTMPGQISVWTRRIAFSPDGNSIAALSAEEDRMVRFFHAPSLKEIDDAEASKKESTSSPP